MKEEMVTYLKNALSKLNELRDYNTERIDDVKICVFDINGLMNRELNKKTAKIEDNLNEKNVYQKALRASLVLSTMIFIIYCLIISHVGDSYGIGVAITSFIPGAVIIPISPYVIAKLIQKYSEKKVKCNYMDPELINKYQTQVSELKKKKENYEELQKKITSATETVKAYLKQIEEQEDSYQYEEYMQMVQTILDDCGLKLIPKKHNEMSSN